MRATGIVRRIDDLGRVVIPKEIRKTLRIREGDPLEIFTDKEGEIILKKYSPICELSDFALQYAESLFKSSGHITCISDRDTIIAVVGTPKKGYLGKSISTDLEKVIEERTDVLLTSPKDKMINIIKDDDAKYNSQVVSPIISDGDPIGAVIFLSLESDAKMTELEVKLASSASIFLGKQLE
ncbi:MAG: stage V sporulation protein T [Clostridiales bacterium]|nr:stage V sporulation protein T [Clostridiales bacterium]